MKVGIALNMLCQPGRSDAAVVGEHLAMGDLAEPLGFDSLFALEHHFTGYAMSPAPLQLLAYYAGRTSGFSSGRRSSSCRGTTRSASPRRSRCSTYCAAGAACSASAGVPRASNMRGSASRWGRRGRALSRRRRSSSRRCAARYSSMRASSSRFRAPRSVRGRSRIPEQRFYASAVSPESAEIMAKLGFGILMVMQNEWPKAAEDIARYREIATEVGHNPRPPIILTNVCCAESRDEAQERRSMSRQKVAVDRRPLPFLGRTSRDRQRLREYGKMARTYAKIGESAETRKKATDFYVGIQIVGTPATASKRSPVTAADRPRPSRDRVFVRRDAARGGRTQHASVRRQGAAHIATRPGLRRHRCAQTAPAPPHPEQERLFAPA